MMKCEGKTRAKSGKRCLPHAAQVIETVWSSLSTSFLWNADTSELTLSWPCCINCRSTLQSFHTSKIPPFRGYKMQRRWPSVLGDGIIKAVALRVIKCNIFLRTYCLWLHCVSDLLKNCSHFSILNLFFSAGWTDGNNDMLLEKKLSFVQRRTRI